MGKKKKVFISKLPTLNFYDNVKRNNPLSELS